VSRKFILCMLNFTFLSFASFELVADEKIAVDQEIEIALDEEIKNAMEQVDEDGEHFGFRERIKYIRARLAERLELLRSSQASQRVIKAHEWLIHRLEILGTPKAAVIIACVYGLSQGVSNFLWAFNWAWHANAAPETAAIIQEIGGLSASLENFLLGVAVPVGLYFSAKELKKHQESGHCPEADLEARIPQ
jgi:hypothetical protein